MDSVERRARAKGKAWEQSAGGLSGGGGSHGGEGGPAASGPAGIVYGSADLSFLMGGSGGGVGNLGKPQPAVERWKSSPQGN